MIDELILAIETSSARGSVALARVERAAPAVAAGGPAVAATARAVAATAPAVAAVGPTVAATGAAAGTTAAVAVPCSLLGERTLAADRRHTAELLPAIRDLLGGSGFSPGDVGIVCFSQGPGSFTGLRVATTVARMWQSAVGSRVVAVPSLEVIARNALAGAAAGTERDTLASAAGSERDTKASAAGPEHDAHASAAGTEHDASASTRPAMGGAWPATGVGGSDNPLAVIVDARGGRIFGAMFEYAPANAGSATQPADVRVVEHAAVHEAQAWLATLPRPCVVVGEGVAKYAGMIGELGLVTLPEELGWPRAREVAAIGARLAVAGSFCAAQDIVPLYLRPPECEEVFEQRRAAAKAKRDMNVE